MASYVEGATVFWSRDILKTGKADVFWGLHSCFYPEPCIAILDDVAVAETIDFVPIAQNP